MDICKNMFVFIIHMIADGLDIVIIETNDEQGNIAGSGAVDRLYQLAAYIWKIEIQEILM